MPLPSRFFDYRQSNLLGQGVFRAVGANQSWFAQHEVEGFTEMRGYFVLATALTMILSPVLLARSDDTPNLDVRPVCRGIASQSASNPEDVGIRTSFEQCMQSEQAVREELKQAWHTFSAPDKQHCVALTQTGGESSYTELLTCLEMARDVRGLRSSETAASSTTTLGQAPALQLTPTVQPAPADASASRSTSAKKAAKSEADSTLKELQRVKANAENARASEALAQRKLADTEADLKRAKQEAARATKEAEQAKAEATAAQDGKAEADRKLAAAEAARSAAEDRLKASESAAKNQRGFGAWLRRWFGRKPPNQPNQ
jgi:hypothetical protein